MGWVYPLHVDTDDHVGYQDQKDVAEKMVYVVTGKQTKMTTCQDPIISKNTSYINPSCLLEFI